MRKHNLYHTLIFCLVASIIISCESENQPNGEVQDIENTSENKDNHSIEVEIVEKDFPQFFRCHKSYLVNLHQVKHISGNAQGHKLHLFYGDELIPVSRKNNSIIKEKLEIFTKKQV